MIAVADSYNAMTSDRPYRRAMTPGGAIEQLVLGKGSQYEAGPVDAFLRVLEQAPEWYRRGYFVVEYEGAAHGRGQRSRRCWRRARPHDRAALPQAPGAGAR